MNKSFLFLGLASVMSAFTGCTTDEADNVTNPEQQPSTAPQTLVAQLQDDNATRVAVSPTGKSLCWSEGDVIAVYADNALNKLRYRLKPSSANSTRGEFELVANQTGNIKKASYGTFDGVEEFTYVAVYPNSQFYLKTSYPMEIGATIPRTQYYVEGSVDPKAAPLMAVFNTDTPDQTPTSLKFKYLASFIRLPLAAAAPLSLQRVVVSANKAKAGNSIGKLCGTISWRFYPSLYYNKKKERDINFTDMTQPMDFRKAGDVGISSFQDQIELMTEDESPIDIGGSVKDFYFGVLPYAYGDANASTHLIFSFYFADGTVVEKKTAEKGRGGDLKPGEVLTLPTFTFDVPYMPKAQIADDMMSWDGNKQVADSCEIVVWQYREEILTTIPLKRGTTSAELSKVVYPALEKLVGKGLLAGQKYELSLGVKAHYNPGHTSSADAVYSTPIDIPIYTAPIPAIQAEAVPNFPRNQLCVDNYQAYSKVDYALVTLDSDREPVESDFEGASYTTFTSSIMNFDAEYWKTYGIMVRSYVGKTVHEKKMLKYALAIPDKKLDLKLGTENFEIPEYDKLNACYKPSATTVYFVEGKDVTDFTNAQSVAYDKYGMSYDGFLPDGYWNKDWTFKVVMESTYFEGGSIEETKSIHIPKPWWM